MTFEGSATLRIHHRSYDPRNPEGANFINGVAGDNGNELPLTTCKTEGT